ncbi:MAG: single-stranded-DNA-specific exonuclease RecJ [Desulfatitalea sp.]|nr:single-stranded-DNA-specific exonuclease RecJ [Desulfatitalea sp.]NNK00766.1 single-stranded-DNA-specific exonuclease RecJ [Desulfatitalea sp.]
MQWKILSPDPNQVQEIQNCLQCHPITAKVLANRKLGATDQIHTYLNPKLGALPDPASLAGMQTAVARIVRAIQGKEKILIFGDYDADGITATAVLNHFLRVAGARTTCHLPHRVEEGYGLRPMHITHLAVRQGIGLIITVDNGSGSHDAIHAAAKFGIDVIVTDHHNIVHQLPGAHAVLNPKRAAQPSDLTDLAGVGVAFYLTIALRTTLREMGWWRQNPEPNLKAYCDFVAIGTVADMVSLKGINRVLVLSGLDQINRHPRPGITALLRAAGMDRNAVTAEDIAYRLSPRINAAGRMAHAKVALDLLCAQSIAAAEPLAHDLNVLNQRRQQLEAELFHHIVAFLDARADTSNRKSLLVAGANWHEGVLGIVATKLVERYRKPVLVLSGKDCMAKGSGRSVPHIDLYDTLNRCAHLLETFGGHSSAAGLSLRLENIDPLRHAFEAAVQQAQCETEAASELLIDSELNLDQIDARLIDDLERLSPFGTDNPAPIFMARNVRVTSAAMVGHRHRKMTLCQPHQQARPIDAMLFNLSPDTPRPDAFDRIAFRLKWHHYRSSKQIQMVVEAF